MEQQILFHTAMSLFSGHKTLENLVKTSYNACVTLREADHEELRMMRLDPFVFPLGFRNGDSFGKRGSHSPPPGGANRAIKVFAGPTLHLLSLVCVNSDTEL